MKNFTLLLDNSPTDVKSFTFPGGEEQVVILSKLAT